MFTALLGYLVGEDWATPKIEELRISPDRCILARVAGDVSCKTFIGAEADPAQLIRGWNGDRPILARFKLSVSNAVLNLHEKIGEAAVEVLDHRLAGAETKSLIGQPGLETSHRVKQVVQAIKRTME